MVTFGEIAGIVALAWLVLEKGLKPVRDINSAWERTGRQTVEWPVCYRCEGRGECGPQERVCLKCDGSGRLSPGFPWRLRKTLKALLSN